MQRLLPANSNRFGCDFVKMLLGTLLKKRKPRKRDVISFSKVFDRRYPTVPSRQAMAESRYQGVLHSKPPKTFVWDMFACIK